MSSVHGIMVSYCITGGRVAPQVTGRDNCWTFSSPCPGQAQEWSQMQFRGILERSAKLDSWNSQCFFHFGLTRRKMPSQGRRLCKILQVPSAACAANHLKTRNPLLRWQAALEVCRDYTWLSLERDIFALVSTSQHVSTCLNSVNIVELVGRHGGPGIAKACTAALSSCGRARCWGKVQRWFEECHCVLPQEKMVIRALSTCIITIIAITTTIILILYSWFFLNVLYNLLILWMIRVMFTMQLSQVLKRKICILFVQNLIGCC